MRTTPEILENPNPKSLPNFTCGTPADTCKTTTRLLLIPLSLLRVVIFLVQDRVGGITKSPWPPDAGSFSCFLFKIPGWLSFQDLRKNRFGNPRNKQSTKLIPKSLRGESVLPSTVVLKPIIRQHNRVGSWVIAVVLHSGEACGSTNDDHHLNP